MLGRNVGLSAAVARVMARVMASDIDLGGSSLDVIGYKHAKPHKTPNGRKASGVAASKRLAAKRNNIRKRK